MNDTLLGIIGGMGPEATINFYSRVIKYTHVNKDQDHFRVIIDCNAKIPDRTNAILSDGESPLRALIDTAKNLESLGVQIAAIPCVTSHYYFDALDKNTSMKLIHIIRALNENISDHYNKTKKIGVLATTGTVKSKLFDHNMPTLEVLYPTVESQEKKVMEAIYGNEGIKNIGATKRNLNLLIAAGNELIERGAEIIIAGCTEIGVVLNQDHFNTPLLDPMDILAKALISAGKNE